MISLGEYGNKDAQIKARIEMLSIKALNDNKLLHIKPREKGFFENALDYQTRGSQDKDFIELVLEAKYSKPKDFYVPIMDPAYDKKCDIIFYNSKEKPAINLSYNRWLELVKKMPSIKGYEWRLATVYDYALRNLYFINSSIENGKDYSFDTSFSKIIIFSRKLGNNSDSSSDLILDNTGTNSQDIGGHVVYDLGNTRKILAPVNPEDKGFFTAGFSYKSLKDSDILTLEYHDETKRDDEYDDCVAMLVLSKKNRFMH